MSVTIGQLNTWDRARFLETLGPLFEHSPWIAEEAWTLRPFGSREELLEAMYGVVRAAGRERQVALIEAHPDLAGRLARQGLLTAASTAEQASAGLNALSPEEVAKLGEYNRAYREKFGFPFVICARLNHKAAILEAFARRLPLDRETEIDTALGEIEKIARLRLADLMRQEGSA